MDRLVDALTTYLETHHDLDTSTRLFIWTEHAKLAACLLGAASGKDVSKIQSYFSTLHSELCGDSDTESGNDSHGCCHSPVCCHDHHDENAANSDSELHGEELMQEIGTVQSILGLHTGEFTDTDTDSDVESLEG